MSLVLAVLYESNWLREDGAKLFFFGACFLGVLAVAKWASRTSENSYEPPDATSPFNYGSSALAHASELFPNPDEIVHPELQIGNIEIRAFYFSKFNAVMGPPDPSAFCDELTIEVHHIDTSHRSVWHFTVGTPAGFESLMREKGWDVMYSPGVFVFNKYDLEAIRQEVIDRIQISLSPTPEEASDAAGYQG